MADKTIAQLPAAASLTGDELVPIWQSGSTKETTTQDIANLASGGTNFSRMVASLGSGAELGNGDSPIVPVTLTIPANTMANGGELHIRAGLWLGNDATTANDYTFTLSFGGANFLITTANVDGAAALTPQLALVIDLNMHMESGTTLWIVGSMAFSRQGSDADVGGFSLSGFPSVIPASVNFAPIATLVGIDPSISNDFVLTLAFANPAVGRGATRLSASAIYTPPVA